MKTEYVTWFALGSGVALAGFAGYVGAIVIVAALAYAFANAHFIESSSSREVRLALVEVSRKVDELSNTAAAETHRRGLGF